MFAGKVAFASTGGSSPFYLTQKEIKNNTGVIRLPAMSGRSLGDPQRIILYAQSDGTMRIQMPSLLWIALERDPDWLVLSENAADAVPIRLFGSPAGERWYVQLSGSDLRRVYYSLNQASPILGVMRAAGETREGFDTFAPTVITKSLQEMQSTKDAREADLRFVDLSGERLDEITFYGANFSGGRLDGATFAQADLRTAKFVGSSLKGIRCDGARLDGADMTRAKLDGTSWGSPLRALSIVLTGCSARDAVLGGQASPLDCSNANLAGGDFRGANLQGLFLKNAEASGAILAGCNLDKANLDGAKLINAVAVGASLIDASMQEVNAQGASFVRANLTRADLSRARMGAKAWLFAIESTFSTSLDEKKLPPALIDAFNKQGVKLMDSDEVREAEPGRRWTISDPAGPYVLVMNAAAQIDVFRASPDLRPTTLRGAICQGTRAPGASLAGADLRGVQWYSTPATLDHADLESAALSGSLLVQTDFTQAYLAGADLSECVLVQAGFRGCLLRPYENGRPFSLEGSLLQEANFEEATLVGALLTDSAVALVRGVPLFRLDKTDEQYLNGGDVSKLASAFEKSGYPLGDEPKLSQSKTWVLDNRADPNSAAPRWYRVRPIRNTLHVYDGAEKRLFGLDSLYEELLSRPSASQELVAAFGQAGYSLCLAAPINVESYWQIDVGADVLGLSAVSYPVMRIYAEAAHLPVFASVLLRLRDWPQYPDGIAFSATVAIERALNAATLGPSGYPRSLLDAGFIDLETFMTVGG